MKVKVIKRIICTVKPIVFEERRAALLIFFWGYDIIYALYKIDNTFKGPLEIPNRIGTIKTETLQFL